MFMHFSDFMAGEWWLFFSQRPGTSQNDWQTRREWALLFGGDGSHCVPL